MRKVYTWMLRFGFHKRAIVHETVSGYHDRNFPRAHRWRDQKDDTLVWVRAGLYVFDFKGRKMSTSDIPDGRRTLLRYSNGYTVRLHVEVQRAFMQSRAVVGDHETARRDRPIYSKNCGRAVLRFLGIEILDHTDIPKDAQPRTRSSGAQQPGARRLFSATEAPVERDAEEMQKSRKAAVPLASFSV